MSANSIVIEFRHTHLVGDMASLKLLYNKNTLMIYVSIGSDSSLLPDSMNQCWPVIKEITGVINAFYVEMLLTYSNCILKMPIIFPG